MALPKTDRPETAGIVVEMRQYAEFRAKRDVIILEALTAGIQVWRIAAEMGIDRKTIMKVRNETREGTG
jgi:DNA-binding NarL/FixJ family response regulator